LTTKPDLASCTHGAGWRRHTSGTDGVLGMGHHSRPVRPASGRGRRRRVRSLEAAAASRHAGPWVPIHDRWGDGWGGRSARRWRRAGHPRDEMMGDLKWVW